MAVDVLSYFSAPPVWVFHVWQKLRMLPTGLITFIAFAVASVFGVAIVIDFISWLAGKCISHERLSNCFQSSCCQQVKSIGSHWTEHVGRTLCPRIFPQLFTEHKIRVQAQESSPKVFIVFLNRDLNDHFCFWLVFSVLSFLVLAASATAFMTSIPLVYTGPQCLEEDKSGYPLLCYKDDDAYPEDCTNINHANFTFPFAKNNSDHCLLYYTNITDFLENITNSTSYMNDNIAHYTCYTWPWTLHLLGVAFGLAIGVFKLAITFTTVYVRMSSWCLTNSSRYVKWIFIFALLGCGVICLICYVCYSLFVFTSSKLTDQPLWPAIFIVVTKLTEYTYLPMWMCLGFAVITWKMEAYCKQAEYCTLSPDQFPPPRQLPEQERQCGPLQVAVAT